jgi:uncharacterized protein
MHPNEALIRASYEAMARHDGAYLANLLAPDARWVICGEGPLSGTYTGQDEIFRVWKMVAAQTGGGLQLDIQDVLANDERAVVLVTARGERKGHSLKERQVAIFELTGGHVTEARFLYENPDEYDTFWSR